MKDPNVVVVPPLRMAVQLGRGRRPVYAENAREMLHQELVGCLAKKNRYPLVGQDADASTQLFFFFVFFVVFVFLLFCLHRPEICSQLPGAPTAASAACSPHHVPKPCLALSARPFAFACQESTARAKPKSEPKPISGSPPSAQQFPRLLAQFSQLQ
jgi:hypothetical protein